MSDYGNTCDCDLRIRRWNPNTRRCETCMRFYGEPEATEKRLPSSPGQSVEISRLTARLAECEMAKESLAKLLDKAERERDEARADLHLHQPDYVRACEERDAALARAEKAEAESAECEKEKIRTEKILAVCSKSEFHQRSIEIPALRAEVERLTAVVRANKARPNMHPLGECRCGGEDTCVWCQRNEEWERLRGIEEAPKLTPADCFGLLSEIGRAIESAESAMGKGMSPSDVSLNDAHRRGKSNAYRFIMGRLTALMEWKGIAVAAHKPKKEG